VIAALADQGGLLIKTNPADTVYTPALKIVDGPNGASILEVGNFAGLALNDLLKIYRAVFAEPNHWFDIYGYRMQNGLAEFAYAGPPGNMLSFADACFELFEGSRAATLGTWQVVFGSATLAQHDEGDGVFTPAGSRWSARITAGGGAVFVGTATGVFAYPAVAGQTYSVVPNVRRVGATARNAQSGFQYFDAGGGFLSQSYGSAAATTQGAWVTVPSGVLVAPASTAFLTPVVQLPATGAGEAFDLGGQSVYKSAQTVFAPPFVAQPYPNGGQAFAGAWWRRSDTPGSANQRLYVCTTGGLPHQQVWAGVV